MSLEKLTDKSEFVVIGASYGDEGKGVVCRAIGDYITSQVKDPSIDGVELIGHRFNGGSQALHHAFVKDEVVGFKMLPSISSIYNNTMICGPELLFDPIVYLDNVRELSYKYPAFKPDLFISRSTTFISLYDVITNLTVNELIQEITGEHVGTCGAGIYEAFLRKTKFDDFPELNTSYGTLRCKGVDQFIDLMDINYARYLENFRIPKFNADYNGDYTQLFRIKYLNTFDIVMESFYDKYNSALTTVFMMASSDSSFNYSLYHVHIHEGAQGLGLSFEKDPIHSTASITGVKHVNQEFANPKKAEVFYVSRIYNTRHGSGPLAGECTPYELNIEVDFEHNKDNSYQGNFRYAPLDINKLTDDINTDIKESPFKNNNIVLTCIQQLKSDKVKTVDHGDLTVQQVVDIIKAKLNFGNSQIFFCTSAKGKLLSYNDYFNTK